MTDNDYMRYIDIAIEKTRDDFKAEFKLLHSMNDRLENIDTRLTRVEDTMATRFDINRLEEKIEVLTLEVKSLDIDRDDHDTRIAQLERTVSKS